MIDYKKIAAQIKSAIEQDVGDDNNPDAIADKIKTLAALTGSGAALQAWAKKNLRQKESELLQQYIKLDLPPSVLMRKITAEAFEEDAFLTYTERLNAGISHSIEGLRSVLSYIKADWINSKGQT